MSKQFHKVRVKSIRRETAECVSIEFDITEDLRPLFDFKQGQNVTIKSHLDDVRRTYSICSSPLENRLAVAVKKVPDGVFSRYALEVLQPGDELEIMQPAGSFYTELLPGQKKNYLFLAAGSGITPVISIIKSVFETELESTVTLVYGNRNASSIIFKEELEGLKNLHLTRFNLIYIISREPTESPLHSGRIDVAKLAELEKVVHYKAMDEIFICGPEAMIFTARDYFKALGIDGKKIHFELFTTAAMQAQGAASANKTDTSIMSTTDVSDVKITVDGRTYEVAVPYKKPTILDAGLNMGINLPYSCKGGVCTTCRAKLLEGEVEMDCNYGLEDYEVEEGYILTCQAHPRTSVCVVDYDQ